MTRTDIETIINHPEKITDASRPKKSWEFIGVDSKNYNIDMAIYKDKKGTLYRDDADWELGF